ncbi:unnamed protein product [Phaedon cochleariae]|uniref:Uncharacterized protein n=1 Tax=Phaedon cochleariae TaxID=80249 RepID=A0A9N9X358_PHACE|nr:unnamed protein product [Phaedon cochleariae]
MPVKTEPKMNLIDYLMIDPITEPLLPDDIWKKFELDFPEISGGIDDVFEETTVSVKSEIPYLDDLCEIRNHDCMWAGHCGSKEHPSDESHAHCLMRPPAVPVKVEVVCPPPPPQQSLLKPAVRAANAALPQTPPMSDDEECKRSSTSVLKLLHDAIEDCDLDEDSDLCDYFEDKEEVNVEDDLEEEEEEQERARSNIIKSYQFAAESDHSYHKGKAAATHVLGIETPSDSGESLIVGCLFVFFVVLCWVRWITRKNVSPKKSANTMIDSPMVLEKQSILG